MAGWWPLADAVTHLCTGFLFKAATRGPMVPVFVAGTMLPDLLSRGPAILLTAVHTHVHPLPPALLYCWGPLHLPMGILLWCLLLAMLFPESQRRAALANLLGGGALHVVLDLAQRHVGLGYPLLVPFSGRDFELGLIGSEATVPWAPVVALCTVALWWFRRVRFADADSPPPDGEGRRTGI